MSISTASFPPRYAITLANPKGRDVSDHELRLAVKAGQEALSDAVMAGPSKRLVERRTKSLIPSIWVVEGPTSTRVESEVIWWTAEEHYPCSCALSIDPRQRAS